MEQVLAFVINRIRGVVVNMRRIWKKLLVVALVFFTGTVSGCTGNSELHGGNYDNKDCWKTITFTQNSGRKLSLDLPFELNDNGDFESDDIVRNAEWHRYEDDNIFVSVDHCRFFDAKSKINFNLQTFMADFVNYEKMHPALQKIETRIINGKEMTYAEIQAEDNGRRKIECLGMDSGKESWTIVYVYRNDDTAMQKLVEKSMATVSLQ